MDSSDVSDAELTAVVLLKLRRKRKMVKSFSVHSLWKRRREEGAHDNLVKEMAIFDSVMFREYTRMTVEQYEDLHQIGPHLASAPTRKDTISPSEKLMITIRYLASVERMKSFSFQFRMGLSTIDTFIPTVLGTIWKVLQPTVLKMPETDEEWLQIIRDFEIKWQFPHCCGTMDGKQVVIQAPAHSGSEYFNYKHAHSVNLLAVCDANYNFIVVDVGARGRQSDGRVFRSSNFGRRLFSRSLNLPPPTELNPGSPLIPHFLVADEAFPLDKNIMRSYLGRAAGHLPNEEKIFNYRLSRARRTIENTFGIMVLQWRILGLPINVHVNNIKLIILGAVCLHNFVKHSEKNLAEDMQYYCPSNVVDKIENGIEVDGEWRKDVRMDAFQSLAVNVTQNLSAVLIRNNLKHYFMNEGKISWQQQKVDKRSI